MLQRIVRGHRDRVGAERVGQQARVGRQTVVLQIVDGGERVNSSAVVPISTGIRGARFCPKAPSGPGAAGRFR
jgi:hypothetical protein